LEQAVKITKTNGFSLLELMIVLAIFGIMASTASFYMGRYSNNTKLRTAARDLATDFNTMKAGAVSNLGTTYTIVFDKTANTYTTTIGTNVVPKPVASSDHGSAYIFSLPGGGTTYTLAFLARGTFGSFGTITLKNNRGSSANIIFTITGKTYVTFTMQ
jgi:prepilin-type N-terminal cleavage/methylation domain-containing protein